MPNFVRRLFRISFRTERLIMNIIGLINSTFDWSRLKWTNELEQIQNMSLTYGTLILGTIGEDTIKIGNFSLKYLLVLSWIVITRIVIAHVYTITHLINMYPILTGNRPHLLLPWLILSFFKNVVLEVIVLAVCLLYWYDKRFSLAILLEFVLIKIVPLTLATYNWYSTSCFFLELRHAEKISKFRKSLRNGNILTGRLFAKIADSRYRSRSFITLLSYESYETVDTRDTISRIFDDPDLTPVQKTMKILGISQQDVTEARIRRKERVVSKKLTEIVDEFDETDRSIPRSFFVIDDDYEEQIGSFLERKGELAIGHSTMLEQGPSPPEDTKEAIKLETRPRAEFEFSETTEPNRFEEAEIVSTSTTTTTTTTTTTRRPEETDAPTKETEGSEQRCCSGSSLESGNQPRSTNGKEERTKLRDTALDGKRSIESHCDCRFRETIEHRCSLANEIVWKSSTPKRTTDTGTMETDSKSNSREHESRSCIYEQSILDGQTRNRRRDVGVASIEESLSGNDKKISEGTRGKSCSMRLIAKEKLMEEVERVTNKMENLEINERKMFEGTAENPYPEILETKEESGNESKIVNDRSRTKTLIVHEDLKQRVLLVTNRIDDILRNFKYDPSSRRSTTEEKSEQRPENRIERNRGVSVGVDKLSTILKDTIEKAVASSTNTQTPATIDSERSKAKSLDVDLCSFRDASPTRNMTDRYEVNRLTANLPEYSFGDTGIRRFFEGSMKVFDGCYEQDFDDNSELQCIYRQLEKNKWNPFAGRSDLEVPLKRNDEIDRSTVPASTNVYSMTNDREKVEINRSKTSTGSASEGLFHREYLISRKIQANERSLENASRDAVATKSGHVQTDLPSPLSDKTVVDASANASLKRKRLQDRGSASSIRDHRDDTADTRHSSNCHRVEKRNKRLYDPNKEPVLAESPSYGSECECKMQQLQAKCSPSSESRLDSSFKKKGDRRRGRLDSFGTVTLSGVARDSEVDGVTRRKKPPTYPKRAKLNVPLPKIPKKIAAVAPIAKKIERSKRPNARTESLVNAREMRALKAYNEITLLRDKEHFDAKRKVVGGGTTPEPFGERSWHRARSKRSNFPGKKVGQDSKSTTDEYVGKENLSADTSVELQPLAVASASNRDKSFNETVRFIGNPNENYSCSNLSKVNRVTDKIFDRLFSNRMQSHERARSITDADTRKRLSKYSNPKRMIDEQVVSASSSKRLEGMQTGRELERTPAKEDIRDRFTDGIGSNEDGTDAEMSQDRSLSTIKPVIDVDRDTASAWSVNSIDRTDKASSFLEGCSRTEERSEPTAFTERADTDSVEAEDREDTSVTKGNESEADLERDSGNVESFDDEIESGGGNSDYGDPSRNIDVNWLVHGFVLSNASTDASKQPLRRDIVDDDASRLLHNAFSYRSMDSIFDFAEDGLILLANDGTSNALDDGFVCRSSNDAVDVFTESTPFVSLDPDSLERTVRTVVRESRQLNRQEESTIRIEEFRSYEIVPSSQFPRSPMNVDSCGAVNPEPAAEFLRDASARDDAEEPRRRGRRQSIVEEKDAIESGDVDDQEEQEKEENSEEKEEEEMEDRTLRFIEENVFTNIKFPLVINWSDSLTVSNEVPDPSNSMFDRQIERTERPRSFTIDNSNDEKTTGEKVEKLGGEMTKSIVQSVFFGALEFSSEPGRSCRGTIDSKRTFDERSEKTGETFDDSELTGSREIVSSEQASTDNSSRITKYFVSDEITNASRSEGAGSEKLVEIDEGTRSILNEDGKEETIEPEERPDRVDQRRKQIAESNEPVSWICNAVFVMILFWFYVRNFYRTLVSPSRLSRLKPFDIHSVTASTITILESEERRENEAYSLARLEPTEEDLRAKGTSSDITETRDRESERIEQEVEEAMLFLGEHLSENVRIPSFSDPDQERRTRSDLRWIERVETSVEIGTKYLNERVSDSRTAEQEIRTFQFEDDSGSGNSSFEDDKRTALFVDDLSAEQRIDQDGVAENIERIEKRVFRGPIKEQIGDRGFLEDETTVIGGKIEEAEGSNKQAETRSGPSHEIVESSLRNIDSFDSTYSQISDSSKRTVSAFGGSSMEEFPTSLDQRD